MTNEQRCETCRFWQFSEEATHSSSMSMGHCHRQPPGFVMVEKRNQRWAAGRWPLTEGDDWCGEWSNVAGEVNQQGGDHAEQ